MGDMLSLPYLLSDSARLLRRAFDARVRMLGMTSRQARLLLILHVTEGENQGYYAELLEVEPISLTRMIDRMEEAGLIERRRDPADRRAWRVHLTPAGLDLLPELREGIAPMVEAMLAGFGEAERDQLGRMLELVRVNLNTALEPEVAAHG